jgi:ribosomal protein S18 acetylase RimI-like enzyme
MKIRPYEHADREACLAVFDTNIPKFFSIEERSAFADFLDRTPGRYVVVCDDDGAVVGSGGLAQSLYDPNSAALTWGMIDARRQGQGFGRALTAERLRWLETMPEFSAFEVVRIDTSHETEAFYEKFGFRTVRRIPNGYREGLDRCDMERPARTS